MPVISVSEDQIPDQIGNLTDVYTVTFTIAGRPGSFTVQVPRSGDPVAAAAAAVGATTDQVNAIYAV